MDNLEEAEKTIDVEKNYKDLERRIVGNYLYQCLEGWSDLPFERTSEFLSSLRNKLAKCNSLGISPAKHFFRCLEKSLSSYVYADVCLFDYDQAKKIRETEGLSQEVLAKKLGVLQSTLSGWETGRQVTSTKYEIYYDWLREHNYRGDFPDSYLKKHPDIKSVKEKKGE